MKMHLKTQTLAWLALAALLLAAAGLWTVSSLLPRQRPERAPEGTLAKAVASGSPDELRRALAVQPVDAEDAYGFTALDSAARRGRTAAIRELVRAGADPNGRDHGPNGWVPLEHAVHKGQLGAVRALLAAGADPDGRSERGLTPLMLAAAQSEGEIVDALLAAGADPRLTQAAGQTALTYAVTSGDERVIRSLLLRAPDLRLERTWRGRVARLLARLRGQSRLLAELQHPQVAAGGGR